MRDFLPSRYVLQPVTTNDLQIASLAWGFTLGFGFLTTWTAIRQTNNMKRRYGAWKLNSPYIWMIWLEILVCAIFSIICWLHLNAIIPPSFAFYFVILTTWALQVQFLLQIIINRVSILLIDQGKAMRLKIGVAVLITAVNISVYCIWIPARLQISDRYEHINDIWDRIEKGIYLCVDAALNYYFIRTVQKQLVDEGLTKYGRLVRFNMWIIGFSLSMDVLIIGMMSLNNSFVYMQFHPLAYIVKLNIEMSMADLIGRVSRRKPAINPLEIPIHDSTTSYLHSPSPTLTSFTSGQRAHITSNPNNPSNSKLQKPKPKAKPKLHQSPSTSSVDVELDEIVHGRSRDGLARGVLEVNMKKEISLRVDSRKMRRKSFAYGQEGGSGDDEITPHPGGERYGAGNTSNILGSLKVYGGGGGGAGSGVDKKHGGGGMGNLSREVSSTSSAAEEMGVSTKVFV